MPNKNLWYVQLFVRTKYLGNMKQYDVNFIIEYFKACSNEPKNVGPALYSNVEIFDVTPPYSSMRIVHRTSTWTQPHDQNKTKIDLFFKCYF
jgi:hypothetical protein